MSAPFVGEIRAFGFNFAPQGWALCNGQTLSINQNQALFALIGTSYGGDGVQTFMLPNLQGRLAVGGGQGPGLQNYTVGESTGEPTHQLATAEMPAHGHSINAYSAPPNPTYVPGPAVILASASTDQSGNPGVLAYGSGTLNTTIAPLGNSGGGVPHENQMPYLVMNYCIALQGIFPSRN